MKKIILMTAVVLYFAVNSLFASTVRVQSLRGQGLIPDTEYDTLNINPAFLVNMQKTGFSVYTGIDMEGSAEKKENLPDGSNTYNQAKTNSSYEIHPSVLFNLQLTKDMAVGILYNPDFENEITEEITSSNIVTRQTTTNKGICPLTLTGLFAMKLGILKLGADLELQKEIKSYYKYKTTNGSIVSNYTSKYDGDDFGIGGKIGAILGFSDFDIGATFKILPSFGTTTEGLYSSASDVTLGKKYLSSLTLKPGITLQKSFDKKTAMRLLVSADLYNFDSYITYDKDSVIKAFGSATYDSSYKYCESKTIKRITEIDASVSLYQEEPRKNLAFAGFNFSYFYYTNAQTVNENTNSTPTAVWQKYSYISTVSTFNGNFAAGFEGRVFSVFIPRVGIDLNVFRINSSEDFTIDGYNTAKAAAEENATAHTRVNSSSFLNSATISAGLGYMPIENLLIEIGVDNFFTLGINNIKSEPDLVDYPTEVTEISSYTFRLYVNARVEF